MTEQLTELEQHVMRHAVGATGYVKKRDYGYRNRYCVSVSTAAHAEIMGMVERGLMAAGPVINSGKSQMFHVTKKGCEAIGLSKAATKRATEE